MPLWNSAPPGTESDELSRDGPTPSSAAATLSSPMLSPVMTPAQHIVLKPAECMIPHLLDIQSTALAHHTIPRMLNTCSANCQFTVTRLLNAKSSHTSSEWHRWQCQQRLGSLFANGPDQPQMSALVQRTCTHISHMLNILVTASMFLLLSLTARSSRFGASGKDGRPTSDLLLTCDRQRPSLRRRQPRPDIYTVERSLQQLLRQLP